MVTAISNGTVTITATSNDDGAVSESFEVTVDFKVLSLSVSSVGNETSITEDSGTLQLVASVLPEDANDPSVTWSVSDESVATVNTDGLITAVSNGTVNVTANTNDGTEISDSIEITVDILVSDISISTVEDVNAIYTDGGTLQMEAVVTPVSANDPSVSWNVDDESIATISEEGVITAIDNGEVLVTASANDGSGVTVSQTITVDIKVSTLSVMGEGNVSVLNSENGSLQMIATVLPEKANDNTITWSVDNESIASISTEGILTAIGNGTVTVMATANDGSEVFGTTEVTVDILASSITVSSEDDRTIIHEDQGTLQLNALVLPASTNNPNVAWSVSNSAIASIDNNGLLTAFSNGTVTVSATVNDASGVSGTLNITVEILVTSIAVHGSGDQSTIDSEGGTLQMEAVVSPASALDQSVTWSVDDTELATISQDGLLTALSSGTITIIATANDGTEIQGFTEIEISIDRPMGIFDNAAGQINLYPNPSTNWIQIEGIDIQNANIQIFNINGTKVHQEIMLDKNKISLQKLNKGVYFLTIEIEGESIAEKIIVE